MYTLYKAVGTILEKGIYHTRSDGKLVKILQKEEADFVWNDWEKNTKTGKYYFFILEYEPGDIITIENYLGKSWTTVIKDINDHDVAGVSYLINVMCRELKEKGLPWPNKLDNLLKCILPIVFSYMTKLPSMIGRDFYIKSYSWILQELGKSLKDYVNREAIDEYISVMIQCYEIGVVEEFYKKENLKISEENALALEKAKEDLEKTIEIAKNLIAMKNIDIQSFFNESPIFYFVTENTPCGKIVVRVGIKTEFDVRMTIKGSSEKRNTVLDISEICKEFEDLYQEEVW
ncbi:MAG: hypothetical protein J6C46_05690 [Clostridia bacterium]|nr:hypothetical protein [Clostridia bacterium]